MNLTISFVIFRNDENLVYQKFQEYLQSNHIYGYISENNTAREKCQRYIFNEWHQSVSSTKHAITSNQISL